jgi:hypothetical protein
MKFRKSLFIAAIVMALAITILAVAPLAASVNEPPKISSLDELLKLYPMSQKAEAAIVHKIPPTPIIIDGTTYQPAEIALFNGQRLGFSWGTDGQEYAFTTVEGLENFESEQRAQLTGSAGGYTPQTGLGWSCVYQNIFFGGANAMLVENQGTPDFGTLDNQISSLANDDGYETYLFDQTNYGGDYAIFTMAEGGGIPPYYSYLWPWGWNDRAESGICFKW